VWLARLMSIQTGGKDDVPIYKEDCKMSDWLVLNNAGRWKVCTIVWNQMTQNAVPGRREFNYFLISGFIVLNDNVSISHHETFYPGEFLKWSELPMVKMDD